MNSQPTILVLEDERPQLLVVRTALDGLGELREFTDPDTALEFLAKNRVDAAIVDIHMPNCRINGMEFIRQVREFDADLCVIIRTGDDSPELADGAIEVRAFRRAIKSKTSTDGLRTLTLDAIKETRIRRQITLDAANASGVKTEWVRTLGSVEEEVTVADSYKSLFQLLRNRLTALAGLGEAMSEAAAHGRHTLLNEHVAQSNALVHSIVAEVNAFMDGPFAQSLRSTRDASRATANRILESLRKHFQTSPRWASDRSTIRVLGLDHDMYVSAPPVRLLTALRHLVEFQLEHGTPGSVPRISAHCVDNLTEAIGSVRSEHLVFKRGIPNKSSPCVAFRISNQLTDTSLEDIRWALHDYPDDPRTGNLQMVPLSLQGEVAALLVHITPVNLTVFDLYVPLLP